jgi:hypothetical protein
MQQQAALVNLNKEYWCRERGQRAHTDIYRLSALKLVWVAR